MPCYANMHVSETNDHLTKLVVPLFNVNQEQK